MDADDFPVSFPLGAIMIHERVPSEDEDREVTNEPIGFVHFKEPILWSPQTAT